jgi:hypothetical protein
VLSATKSKYVETKQLQRIADRILERILVIRRVSQSRCDHRR